MMNFLFSDAYAQAAQGQQTNMLVSFGPFIIIFVIFYFLMIRPQKKKMQDEQAMLGKLGKGDEIFTKSGILGTITGVTEKLITLEVSEGVKLKVLKSQIGGMAKKFLETAKKK